MKNHPLSDEQLLKAKEDIELLVKLICDIGKEHPLVDAIANRIYDTWENHERADNQGKNEPWILI